jgi:hypothetical protein
MKQRVLAATLIAAVALSEAGCSLTMKTVPKDWDGTTEPDCTDSMAPILTDAAIGGFVAPVVAGAALAAEQPEVALAALLLTLPFAISAYIGQGRKRECSRERGQWRIRQERARAPSSAPPWAAPQGVPPVPVLRGFFCASSATAPAAGFCVREKADCQRARDAAIVAVTDLDECRLVETAFCHVAGGLERCAPTMEICTYRARSAVELVVPCEGRL